MAKPISIQLYTLRDEAAKDFSGVVRRVAEIGYAFVEPAGLHGLTPAQFRSLLDGLGLGVSSAHAGAPLYGDELSRALDEQAAIGSPTVVVPMLPPDKFTEADNVKKMAERLNNAVDAVTSRGMRLAYHNHFWEFQNIIDGRPAFDLLVENLHPDVDIELDIYWAQTGGADPAAVAAGLGDRCKLLHVKDGPATEPAAPMVAVGQGVLDIPGALAANDAVQWHVVELDRCATDMFDAVAQSYEYLVGKGLSTGR